MYAWDNCVDSSSDEALLVYWSCICASPAASALSLVGHAHIDATPHLHCHTASGDVDFTTPGTYTWTVPAAAKQVGVVSVMCVGGGGGAGAFTRGKDQTGGSGGGGEGMKSTHRRPAQQSKASSRLCPCGHSSSCGLCTLPCMGAAAAAKQDQQQQDVPPKECQSLLPMVHTTP
jgi:hypothetical protein